MIPQPMQTKKLPALQLTDLCKTYANGVEALKNISLTVKQGDFFALLGANGAGKSTTIGLISSLLKKTSGTILINGHDLDRNPTAAKVSLGIVPQEINVSFFETCEQVLTVQAGFYGVHPQLALKRAQVLLQQLGLQAKCHTQVRHLSGGMKRRLMIARALMHEPALLILDEPTAGVDIEIRHSLWTFLRQLNQSGTTIILTTHYLEEAEQLCQNIAIIDQGSIVENTSTSHLLQQLHHQTLVFSLNHPTDQLPDLSPFNAHLLDSHTFEVRLDTQYSLNDLFAVFDQNKLKIHSMRNKTNRLEELFLDLIHHEA